MHYQFDNYGRFSGASAQPTERSTLVAPAEMTAEYNWTGEKWVKAAITVPEPTIAVQPTAAELLERAKVARQPLVDAITVTTASGRVFGGNEDAQGRMSRAIVAMDDTDTTLWVLHDNALAEVSKAELREALRLSGAAMTAIWVAPYAPA